MSSNSSGFFVATNGSDSSGDGSAQNPFASLTRARDAMENSSIRKTYVEGGTYYGDRLQLTSADSGMSFVAASGQQPVLEGGGGNIITLDEASNVTLQGLTFENGGTYQGAVYLVQSSNNNIIGNLFQNNNKGIYLDSSGESVISGNEFDNSAIAGVLAGNGSSYNSIDSNLFNGTRLSGTGTGSAGIMMTGTNGNVISHNQIENTAGAGIALLNWSSGTENIGNVIKNNSITNADSGGTTDSGGIYKDGRSGGDTNTQILNNFVSLASSPNVGDDADVYLDDRASGATISGNILQEGNFALLIHGGHDITAVNNIMDMGSLSSPNIGAALIQSDGDAGMGGNLVARNIIYSTSTVAPTVLVTYGGTANVTNNLLYNVHQLAMTATYGDYLADSNATYGNPQFANEAAGNYALGSGSAAGSVGFTAIDQSAIGLAPQTAHWY